ncbi:MAG: hypothetical protein AAF404_18010 [Pseudomonadota bacterium]
MTITTHWFVIGSALAAVLCSISIWAPRSVKMKLAALGCAALFLPVGYVSLNDILSRPKPMMLESLHKNLEEASVISSLMKEDEGIYLWLQLPEVTEPRSYKLPWTDEAAKQLHQARQQAETNGTGVKMKKPFERSMDASDPVFYAPPQAALPPKQAPSEQPMVFTSAANTNQ